MAGGESLFAELGASVRERFVAEKRVLSFQEYLREVEAHPSCHVRDAGRYLFDCLEHYGSYEVQRPWGEARRWRLFDLPFEESGQSRDALSGQEELQGGFVRALRAFVREGRPNRLLLLHGPNGSSKSTFARCLMRGLEDYSQQREGALYRFAWVFPRGSDGKGIGFATGGDSVPPPGDTYAHLPEEKVESKLSSELREHPLLLLPQAERRRYLRQVLGEAEEVPRTLWSGGLGHKNRQILEALLTAYRGDLRRVLAHVQVERYYISQRYRLGAVTIGPEMAVDARERQITADRSLGSLPASLSALTLYETSGELVDGGGGVIEFSDLLKRPLDAWRYLLLAIEKGEVSLQKSNLVLNSVLLASSNDLHLNAFQEHPEYHSFQGRLTLLRVPYLRDFRQEQSIYDAQIVPQIRTHVAPHVTELAALWAVLTRLRRSRGVGLDATLSRIAAELSPLEKAMLYAEGQIPRRLGREDAKVLSAQVTALYTEASGRVDYEGSVGASPREMRSLLLDAASSEECVSPLGLFERLEKLCARDDVGFLKLKVDGGYHDAHGFIAQVRQRWMDTVDEEFRQCSGLVEPEQDRQLFERYVVHVSHAIKGEQLYNDVTGAYDDPDNEFMGDVESMLGCSDGPSFREELMGRVAAWAIDHPEEEVDYTVLFPEHIEAVRQYYFEQHRGELAKLLRDVLEVLTGEAKLEDDRHQAATACLGLFRGDFGYEDSSARIALGALWAESYAGE